jgi:hypothetical protein
MPTYIIENIDGVYHFYLPVEKTTTAGQTVTVKQLKYTKTIAQMNAEIAKCDELITKKNEEATNYVANINTQKTQKQVLLALMV